MDELDPAAVWRVLPGRMPGMLPSIVALRFPAVSVAEMTRALESMVTAGNAIRVFRRRVTVYYRGVAPAAPPDNRAGPDVEELPLWT